MPRKKSAAALAALALCCSCAPWAEREPEPARAVRAQMDVKAALLEAEQVAAAPVRVEYESGRIRLTGFVETEAEKARAADAARGAVPDLEVANELQVWRAGE